MRRSRELQFLAICGKILMHREAKFFFKTIENTKLKLITKALPKEVKNALLVIETLSFVLKTEMYGFLAPGPTQRARGYL